MCVCLFASSRGQPLFVSLYEYIRQFFFSLVPATPPQSFEHCGIGLQSDILQHPIYLWSWESSFNRLHPYTYSAEKTSPDIIDITYNNKLKSIS